LKTFGKIDVLSKKIFFAPPYFLIFFGKITF
jgi:hypothetical protein